MIDFSGSDLPPQGYNVSGVSGGPLLIPTLTDKGLIWQFAGVGLDPTVVSPRAIWARMAAKPAETLGCRET